MKRFIRRWRETKGRRDRMAHLLTKFSEILFWLVAVGPFAIQPRIGLSGWLTSMGLLALTSAGSYWYSRDMKGGGR